MAKPSQLLWTDTTNPDIVGGKFDQQTTIPSSVLPTEPFHFALPAVPAYSPARKLKQMVTWGTSPGVRKVLMSGVGRERERERERERVVVGECAKKIMGEKPADVREWISRTSFGSSRCLSRRLPSSSNSVCHSCLCIVANSTTIPSFPPSQPTVQLVPGLWR
jgi:hypothetical protein